MRICSSVLFDFLHAPADWKHGIIYKVSRFLDDKINCFLRIFRMFLKESDTIFIPFFIAGTELIADTSERSQNNFSMCQNLCKVILPTYGRDKRDPGIKTYFLAWKRQPKQKTISSASLISPKCRSFSSKKFFSTVKLIPYLAQ